MYLCISSWPNQLIQFVSNPHTGVRRFVQQHRYLLSLLVLCHATTAVVSSLTLHFVDQQCSTFVLPGNSSGLGSMHSSYAHTHTSTSFLHVACAANTTLLHSCFVVHSTSDSCVDHYCSSVVNFSLQSNLMQWHDLDTRLLLSGLPPHPGPGGVNDFSFLFWNINSLSKYLPILAKYKFDVCFAQEVSAPWHMLSAI